MRRIVQALALGLGALAVVASSGSRTPGQDRMRTEIARKVTGGAVRLGMTEAEVLDALGEPEERAAWSGVELWRYFEYASSGRRLSEAVVELEGGRVVAFDSYAYGGHRRAWASRTGRTPPSPGALEPIEVRNGPTKGAVAPAGPTPDATPPEGAVVPAPAAPPAPVVAPAGGGFVGFEEGVSAGCETSADCGGTRLCKDRGDGRRACMGDGAHGDFCASAVDCAQGFCKPRGDDLKVCMHKGASGQLCRSSVDCASGLLCKERDDGWKVCQ